jgi:dolichol-phosphate mannosyltransferase
METDRTLIVVPTCNERENVGALVAQLLQVAPDADVMLVDDNSPGGTATAAEQLFGTNARFSILSRTGPHSFGRSLLDGYRVALERGYSRVVQLDVDFSHDPNMVPLLIKKSHRRFWWPDAASIGESPWRLRKLANSRNIENGFEFR